MNPTLNTLLVKGIGSTGPGLADLAGKGGMGNRWLITLPTGSRLVFKGQLEPDGGVLWLVRGGKRLWTIAPDMIRPAESLEERIEFLVEVSKGHEL